jgi:hypothetical protein
VRQWVLRGDVVQSDVCIQRSDTGDQLSLGELGNLQEVGRDVAADLGGSRIS